MIKTKQLIILSIFLLGIFGISSNIAVTSAIPTAERCTWTPSNPAAFDILIIGYDPTGGPIDPGVTEMDMHWQMTVERNKFVAVPSQSMWPENTTVDSWLGPSKAITPMVKNASDIWTVSFTFSYMPDDLLVWFQSGATTDKPGSGWKIESVLKTARLTPVTPAFNNPIFTFPGTSSTFIVEANETASDWSVKATGKSDTDIDLNPSATYDAGNEYWSIQVDIPSDMQLGLYDLQYEATINDFSYVHAEYNSLQVIESFKSDYWFVIIADPQVFRDGSYPGGNKDAKTGTGNYSEVLPILDMLDPEFVLVLGDMTEWCDEIAEERQKLMIIENIDVPMFMLPGNHDEFEKTGSSGNREYGSGRGVYERIFGPSHWTFMYGDHYFASAFSDDQHISDIAGESAWIQDVITNAPASATMKSFMMHHPIDERYYGTSESVDIADDIKTWLKQGDIDYFLHGHMHGDYYSELQGTIHIGTDNAVGSNTSSYSQGIRLVHVQDDEFVKFSYDTPDPSAYTAESHPIHWPSGYAIVNTSFSSDNDGSSASNTATFNFGYNHSYEGVRVRFAMQPTSRCYSVTGGEVKSEYIFEGVHYVDVEFDVAAESITTITIVEADCPTETPTETTTTSDEPSTSDGTPGFGIAFLISTLVTEVILRTRKHF